MHTHDSTVYLSALSIQNGAANLYLDEGCVAKPVKMVLLLIAWEGHWYFAEHFAAPQLSLSCLRLQSSRLALAQYDFV